GKEEVVKARATGQTGARRCNEIKNDVAAYGGGQVVASSDELFLKKGRSYSYVLLPGNRSLSLANSIDPTE
ncbi:alginate O-acetyltransferase, partial [Pseudomonas soli]|nr:alginate O-acetyltransferase [Pseudomonas soli]